MKLNSLAARKPIDPPVVVQMHVEQRADATQYVKDYRHMSNKPSDFHHRMFLHNPYLYVIATLQYDDGTDITESMRPYLLGTKTSSLHRLKEVDEEGNWGEGS